MLKRVTREAVGGRILTSQTGGTTRLALWILIKVVIEESNIALALFGGGVKGPTVRGLAGSTGIPVFIAAVLAGVVALVAGEVEHEVVLDALALLSGSHERIEETAVTLGAVEISRPIALETTDVAPETLLIGVVAVEFVFAPAFVGDKFPVGSCVAGEALIESRP